MSAKQNQDRLDKRAAALRENLKKRKASQKPAKTDKSKSKQDDKDGSS